MNVDLSGVSIEAMEDGRDTFHDTLSSVLAQVAPFVTVVPGMTPEDRLNRLHTAINMTLDLLDTLTGVADVALLPSLIERVAELAVTGDNVEVEIGVAGDLQVDARNRLTIDHVLASLRNVPATTRAAATREGITALQRILALLLLHGWTETMGDDQEARHIARQAIVETVQGRLAAGQAPIPAVAGFDNYLTR